MLKLIGCGRVSTEDQADYGTGLETQAKEIRDYAARLGAVLVAHEEDPGVSGTIYPRPGLERALLRIEAGEANGLIVHRVDRIGRKMWIPPVVFERLQACNARLLTVQDGEVTDQNIIMFSLRCGLAQTDYQQIITNMKAGRRRKAESGRNPQPNTRPYGYHIVKKIEHGQVQADAGLYRILPDQAEIVRRIYREYAAGSSLERICRGLNADDIPTPRKPMKREKGVWVPATILSILRNPAYKGFAVWGKYDHKSIDTTRLPAEKKQNLRAEHGRYHQATLRPESDHIQIPVPPILDEALWERCQEVRAANKANTTRSDRKYLLSGVLVCQNCGLRMKVHAGNYKENAARFTGYWCHPVGGHRYPDRPCDRKTHGEKSVLAALFAALDRIKQDPTFARLAYAAYADMPDAAETAQRLASVREQMRVLNVKEEATIEAQITAIETGVRAEIYTRRLSEISAERERLERQVAALAAEARQERRYAGVDMATLAATVAEQLLDVLQSAYLSNVDKNALLRQLVQSISPDSQGGYTITMRPFLETHDSVLVVTLLHVKECMRASRSTARQISCGGRRCVD